MSSNDRVHQPKISHFATKKAIHLPPSVECIPEALFCRVKRITLYVYIHISDLLAGTIPHLDKEVISSIEIKLK